MAEGRTRPAWAEVDLSAIAHNVAVLRRCAAPAAVWAVVKADGYGHGAVPVARAALDAGAMGLAVALVDEGVELRDEGIDAPVLVLSEPAPEAMAALVEARLASTVATKQTVRAVAAAAARQGRRVAVQVKVDTGMHRVGAMPRAVPDLVEAIAAEPFLELGGLFTHLSVAEGTDDEDRRFTVTQLARFDAALSALGRRPPLVHAANTAGALVWPSARYDLVRCGIGTYGLAPCAEPSLLPSPGARSAVDQLRPALSLKARVSAVRRLEAGERPSYGRRRPLPEDALVATVPLGYADGVPRALFGAGYEVLVGGRRRPLAGAVTMDQLVVDCGPDSPVVPGDEVVLIGRQGTEEISALEWARRLGTLTYEVVCGIGARVPRRYVGRPSPAPVLGRVAPR